MPLSGYYNLPSRAGQTGNWDIFRSKHPPITQQVKPVTPGGWGGYGNNAGLGYTVSGYAISTSRWCNTYAPHNISWSYNAYQSNPGHDNYAFRGPIGRIDIWDTYAGQVRASFSAGQSQMYYKNCGAKIGYALRIYSPQGVQIMYRPIFGANYGVAVDVIYYGYQYVPGAQDPQTGSGYKLEISDARGLVYTRNYPTVPEVGAITPEFCAPDECAIVCANHICCTKGGRLVRQIPLANT